MALASPFTPSVKWESARLAGYHMLITVSTTVRARRGQRRGQPQLLWIPRNRVTNVQTKHPQPQLSWLPEASWVARPLPPPAPPSRRRLRSTCCVFTHVTSPALWPRPHSSAHIPAPPRPRLRICHLAWRLHGPTILTIRIAASPARGSEARSLLLGKVEISGALLGRAWTAQHRPRQSMGTPLV